jgi:hypothetical protein
MRTVSLRFQAHPINQLQNTRRWFWFWFWFWFCGYLERGISNNLAKVVVGWLVGCGGLFFVFTSLDSQNSGYLPLTKIIAPTNHQQNCMVALLVAGRLVGATKKSTFTDRCSHTLELPLLCLDSVEARIC